MPGVRQRTIQSETPILTQCRLPSRAKRFDEGTRCSAGVLARPVRSHVLLGGYGGGLGSEPYLKV